MLSTLSCTVVNIIPRYIIHEAGQDIILKAFLKIGQGSGELRRGSMGCVLEMGLGNRVLLEKMIYITNQYLNDLM